jgi:hypothetical protein
MHDELRVRGRRRVRGEDRLRVRRRTATPAREMARYEDDRDQADGNDRESAATC